MRRGQQAQPHSSHTTRRHPRKEGTQRQQPPTMQEDNTSTNISPSSSPQPKGNSKNPRPPHQPQQQRNPHPSMTRHQNFQPSRPQRETEPNSTQSHAVHHTRRKIDSGCALPPPPFSSWPRKKTTAATRNCQHAPQKEHSNPLQCASCGSVVVCACRNTKQNKTNSDQSMWRDAKNVQRRCMAEKKEEEDRSNS
ncbi:hypothetical protein TcCL_Unassigned02872 [Trypanosoma cruzi]|nr:hypothetical protein TcCL_Unassigned02872 [Trypanosoma cruzi]